MHSLCFSLLRFLEGIFSGCRLLCWQFFSFIHCFLASKVSAKKLAELLAAFKPWFLACLGMSLAEFLILGASWICIKEKFWQSFSPTISLPLSLFSFGCSMSYRSLRLCSLISSVCSNLLSNLVWCFISVVFFTPEFWGFLSIISLITYHFPDPL